jgi:stage II sporulation protein D
VGLCQYGADGMARQGRSYEEILRHYYSGVDITPLDAF